MQARLRSAIALLPRTPGVYRFRDTRGRILYVGRATELRSRVRSYWGDLRGRRHLTRMVPRIDRIEAVPCVSVHEAAWLERNLLLVALPPWNRTPGGAEVEVYVRVSERGVSVEHDCALPSSRDPGADRWFGPYLGGTRVRAAVSGLERVLPYASAGATSGTARAMAEVRGVDPTSRAALRSRLLAVLERRPEAVEEVAAALADRRDRLAAALEFELAAKVQAELTAVDWLVAEQRVTAREPLDADVYGWSEPHLVQFRLRAGRVDRWLHTTRCAPARGRRLAAATPAPWRGFAHTAVELAAALAAAH